MIENRKSNKYEEITILKRKPSINYNITDIPIALNYVVSNIGIQNNIGLPTNSKSFYISGTAIPTEQTTTTSTTIIPSNNITSNTHSSTINRGPTLIVPNNIRTTSDDGINEGNIYDPTTVIINENTDSDDEIEQDKSLVSMVKNNLILLILSIFSASSSFVWLSLLELIAIDKEDNLKEYFFSVTFECGEFNIFRLTLNVE